MPLSLRAKLFLTLLCVSLLAVLVSQGFVRWTFERGLADLAAERQARRLEAIAERLVEVYRSDGGWDRLADDRRLWVRTLAGAPPRLDRDRDRRRHAWPEEPERFGGDEGPGRPPPAGHQGPPRWLRDVLRDRRSEPGAWPPRQVLAGLEAGEPPRALELRVMLLDDNGGIVYGRETLLAGAERRPLLDGEAQIGTLVLLPGPPIRELADLRFRARYSVALWLIGLGVALLTALLAFPLSRRLTRPLADFQRTMRRLGGGDYGARVHATGGDELGRLGRDLNALAEALAQTEQARRQWVADISHELRTPLSLLRADVEAMQDGVRPLDQAALAGLHGDALRLGRLIDDLYELSMTDLGALSYNKAPVHLGELLADELEGFGDTFANAGLQLRLEPTDAASRGNWMLDGDAQRLSQLIRNLLRNSLAYTDRGGDLRVTLTRQSAQLCIDFDDSAPGVPAAALPRLFDRLYRVDSSRSRATGGAGLGLAIARNIVAAHGGSITAAPSPLGGLRIHVELPAEAHSRHKTDPLRAQRVTDHER